MKRLSFILATALLMTACATTNGEKQAEVPAIDINNADKLMFFRSTDAKLEDPLAEMKAAAEQLHSTLQTLIWM